MPLLAAFVASGLDWVRPTPSPLPVEGGLEGAPVLVWSRRLPGTPPSTASRTEPAPPVVAGDRIYVGFSGANALLVLDRHDGALLMDLPARATVASAPVLTERFIYFSDTAGYTFAYKRDALDLRTPAWTHFSGAPILSSPTLSDGTLLITNVDDLVFALDVSSGELRWRHAHKSDIARSSELELFGAPPAVVERARGEVLVGFSDGFLVALGLSDGTQRWSAEVGEGAYPDLIAPPLAAASGILVGGYSEPLVSLSPDGRTIQWRHPVGSASAFGTDGASLWHGGADGVLRRIDARTGEITWIWDSGVGGTLGEPVATAQGLLVTSTEGTLHLVDAATGALRWSFEPGPLLTGISGRPAVVDNAIYVVSNAGVLYALRGTEPRKRAISTPDWVSPATRR